MVSNDSIDIILLAIGSTIIHLIHKALNASIYKMDRLNFRWSYFLSVDDHIF